MNGRKSILKYELVRLTAVVGGLLPLLPSTAAAEARRPPNMVIILNDDQGYQDLGCYGSPDIKTPRIDQMAAEGMRCTDFYVASPVCSASRAALLTGCYPNRVVSRRVFFPNRNHGGMSPEHTTIAEVLKGAGYATAAVGKWHLGDEAEFLPTNQGFDSYFGIPFSNDMSASKTMSYTDDCRWRDGFSRSKLDAAFAAGEVKPFKDSVPLMRNEACVEFPCDQSSITRRYADEGIRFISESVKKEQPFFLYLANSMPHTPLFASADFKGKSERGLYGDVVEEIDFNTGRVLDHLKALGIDENTIVIYTSDNGPWLSKANDGGCALPFYEGKFTHFEGGQRVPSIIRWPGTVPAGVTNREIMSSMDLLPTLARAAGAELKTNQPIDGQDVLDLITGKPGAKSPHSYLFYAHYAVRSGNWKYHKKEIFRVKALTRDTDGPSLYNLADDPGESRNLITEHPEVAARLAKALEGHIAATPAPKKTKKK